MEKATDKFGFVKDLKPTKTKERIIVTWDEFVETYELFQRPGPTKVEAKFVGSPYIWRVSPGETVIQANRTAWDMSEGKWVNAKQHFIPSEILWIRTVGGVIKRKISGK